MANFQELSISKSLTVGTTNSVLSEECGTEERTFISVVNTSTGGQSVSIAFGQEAVSLSGIVLYPGGFYSESREAGFKATQYSINIIASGAGATVAVNERKSMSYRGFV